MTDFFRETPPKRRGASPSPESPNSIDLAGRLRDASDIAAFLAVWLEGGLLQGEEADAFNRYYGSFRRSFVPRIRAMYADQIREAEAIVRTRPGLRVLEVGCGMGTESLWLAMVGAKVTAVDVRPERLAVAEERRCILERLLGRELDCRFRLNSLLEIPDLPTFDLIWMEQTFHHLEPRTRMVAKAAKLLRPGGSIVISEANAWNLLVQVQLLLRRGLPKVRMMRGPDGQAFEYGDERITTAGALRQAFARCGVHQRSLRYFRIFPNRAWFDHLAALEDVDALRGIAPLYTHFNYVGVREEEGSTA